MCTWLAIPDLFRKVITVIQYSSIFSGINVVIKFHFTRWEHKTYFFRVLHSGIIKTNRFEFVNTNMFGFVVEHCAASPYFPVETKLYGLELQIDMFICFIVCILSVVCICCCSTICT